MGEKSAKIGRKLEGFGENLISDLGWVELTRDREISCKRAAHDKQTHGIDLLCKFSNPYINGNQGVIIECKNRQMKSINKGEIEKWVKELINTIECSQSTDDLNDLDKSDICTLNTGLLIIHANDVWDENAFYNALHALSVSNKRNPINVFIAGSDKINMWTSLLSKIKADYLNGFSFVYPSFNEFNRKTQASLSLNALFSKYIVAEGIYSVEKNNSGIPYSELCRQNIMFFLDDICLENFKYAWSMFKHFQLQGAGKYVFIFYPQKNGDVEFVCENFKKAIKAGDPHIDNSEIDKICCDFIDNRSLSPIEAGGSR